ncbi:lymphocyte antigen 6D [Scleropages formosus]|uniref:lymphocyte antigen 6D n=1 Tax=Scleropages formosus TaxID=113540 RepID=UPI0010FA733B|nr:lymphocyte antigen 6D [Scleropages formosus]
MKVLLCSLLLVLLCTTQVQALRCYTCEGDSTCKTETECPPSSQYCKTEVSANTFSRTCEEFCINSFSVSCCTEDLC